MHFDIKKIRKLDIIPIWDLSYFKPIPIYILSLILNQYRYDFNKPIPDIGIADIGRTLNRLFIVQIDELEQSIASRL